MYNYSILKLFNAILLEGNDTSLVITDQNKVVKYLFSKGICPTPEVLKVLSTLPMETLRRFSWKTIRGVDDWNKTFFTSWVQISKMSDFEKIVHQLMHYITVCLKDNQLTDLVYVPNTKQEFEQFPEGFKLFVLKGYTRDELIEKLDKMISSKVALKEETLEDIYDAYGYLGEDWKRILDISKNKEFSIIVCDKEGIVPNNPVEFLRYYLYKATGKTLLIKDRETLSYLKHPINTNSKSLNKIFKQYVNREGGELQLAKIFNRFKPIFLTIRKHSNDEEIKSMVNKISKLSKIHHKPMPEDFLNSITRILRNGDYLDTSRLKEELKRAPIFRVIRLYNALNLLSYDDPKVYHIRNGKTWVEEEKRAPVLRDSKILYVYACIREAVVAKVKDNIVGKTFYIPSRICYSAPTTTKDFVGNIPVGSSFSYTPTERPVIGVYWENGEHKRVDLDLSCFSLNGLKTGWNGSHRGSAMYSGDITDAPIGASELLRFSQEPEEYGIYLNFYNSCDLPDEEVAYDMVFAFDSDHAFSTFQKNQRDIKMFAPENIITQIGDLSIGDRQQTLGIVGVTDKGSTFTFYSGNAKNLRVAIRDARQVSELNYLRYNLRNRYSLESILVDAGATIIRSIEDYDGEYIDLSPENLEHDTLISLLT